jgi:ABC-type multidrug transport system fused ATPase/permease subunit
MLLGASVLNIPLELSSFFSSIWALSHLTNHIQNIPYSFTLFGAAIAGTRRISALLEAPELSRHLSLALDESKPKGTPQRLRLTGVKIQFGEIVALDIPELEINLGERTAIVGKVGSGKSLLLELITGERAPSAGEILIEDNSGRWRRLWEQHTYQWFRNQIAYTAQIPFLSNTTLRRNIDLGDDLTLAEVNDAALAAQLNPDISQLTHGVEEEVGETGVNLSGGQKQRVSLARAFASQRSFFILDDPLSSVDRHTEQELMEILCTPGRGIVLVSHRLAELSRCNRVLVLEDGRLIEDGPPELLLSQPRSAFKEFIEAAQTIEQMGEQK